MKTVMTVLMAIAVLAVASENAQAGGGNGGAKRNSTIRVINNSSLIVGVIMDNLSPPTSSSSSFMNSGGQILQPGATANFKVNNGSHTVVAAPITSQSPITVGNQASVNVAVAKGQTRTVSLSNTDTQ